jgi:LytS/YehU family sensor histidine kinase
VMIPERSDDIYIAPLMLLPFVENCFKHGTSNMLQDPWLNLTIELRNETLVMKLMNGKPRFHDNRLSPGIGIANVSQRLELIYAGKYELNIRNEDEVFVVDLSVTLRRIADKPTVDESGLSHSTKVYA